MENLFTNSLVARGWQREFEGVLMQKEKDFLLVATPGAGKTIAAILAARRKEATFLIVVVPKDGLCSQWASAAAEFGIQLCANRDPERDFMRLGYDGIVTTYQALAANPLAYKPLADFGGVMTVFDECHHMAESKSWGAAAVSALGNSDFILSLSGTPYRSDNDPIPFIRYDEERVCVPDFSYGYDQAVRDNVCRPVMFFSRDGDVNFRKWHRSSEFTTLSNRSKLTKAQEDQWYTIATQDVGGFIRDMFVDANIRLTNLRERYDYPYGGIVMCRDQKIAREVVEMIKMETGETPSLVISEDGEAAKKERDAFAQSHNKWLVAVEMVSEGIDIPRLAAMVYAGSAKTQLRWDQAVGRIVRMIKGNHVDSLICATCHFPGHRDLLRFAEEMEKLAVHRLKDIEKKERESGESTGSQKEDDLEIKEGASYAGRTISHDGVEISEAALNLARAEIEQTGARMDPLEYAKLLVATGKVNPSKPKTTPSTERPLTLNEKEAILKKDCKNAIGYIGEAIFTYFKDVSHYEWPSRLDSKLKQNLFSKMNQTLKAKYDPISNSTIKQLEDRKKFLVMQMENLKLNKNNETSVLYVIREAFGWSDTDVSSLFVRLR